MNSETVVDGGNRAGWSGFLRLGQYRRSAKVHAVRRLRYAAAIAFAVAAFATSEYVQADSQDAGAIVRWGQQIVVRTSALTNLVGVAAAMEHSLGLKSDGSIVA